MRPHRYANYNFENPPLLQIFTERILAPVFGKVYFARLLEAVELAPGERVLDFGCGGGIGAREMAKKIGPQGRLSCVEISAFWLELCRRRLQRYDNVDFFQGDIRTLAVPDAAYDLVFVHRVLRFIPDSDRQSVVHSLADKLGGSGRLLICEKMVPRIGFEAHLIRRLAQGAGLQEDYSAREGLRQTLCFLRKEL